MDPGIYSEIMELDKEVDSVYTYVVVLPIGWKVVMNEELYPSDILFDEFPLGAINLQTQNVLVKAFNEEYLLNNFEFTNKIRDGLLNEFKEYIEDKYFAIVKLPTYVDDGVDDVVISYNVEGDEIKISDEDREILIFRKRIQDI